MLAQPRQEARPRIANVRTAKQATQRRISRKERAKYVGLVRFCAGLGVALSLVMLYVMLTARLTSLNYAVAKAQRERTTLQEQTSHLDDRIAALTSDDRLAAVAAKLHMQEPQQFAVVSLPPPERPVDRSHLAFLSGLANFFGAK